MRTTPKIENIPPIGYRISRFIASPEDDVENGRHDQHRDAQRERPLVPRQIAFLDPRCQRVHQPAQLLVRLGARREQRDERGRDETARPREQGGPEVQRHLARIGVQDRAEEPAVNARLGTLRQREPVMQRRGDRPGQQPRKGAMPRRALPDMPSRKVANSGPFTNENTSCRMSLMLLNRVAAYAAITLARIPNTVAAWPIRR